MDGMFDLCADTNKRTVINEITGIAPICKPKSAPWRLAVHFVAQYADADALVQIAALWNESLKTALMTALVGLRYAGGGHAPSNEESKEKYRESIAEDDEEEEGDMNEDLFATG